MTRSMTRWMLAGIMALGAVGAPIQADPPVNPFAGSWSGTFFHIGDEAVGTVAFTISDAGRITGTVYNITEDFLGAIAGHVSADGNLVVIADVPNAVPAGGSGYPSRGTAVIDGDGKLGISVTNTFRGGVSTVAILERN